MVKFLYFIIAFFFILPGICYSALVLKVKNETVLIHLEGVKTQEGAFFRVYNLDNNKKGLIKIERVAQTKAIGTLKTGSVNKKWNLQPISKKIAVAELSRMTQRNKRIALIQKEKMKRKLAQKKAFKRKLARQKALKRKLAQKKALKRKLARQKAFKRKLARQKAFKRKLAQQKALKRKKLTMKKKALNRKVASFSLKEDILEDLNGITDDNMQQSAEILSHPSSSSNPSSENKDTGDSFNDPTIDLKKVNNENMLSYQLGLSLNPQFNYMKITPRNKPKYNMTGIGGTAHIQSFFSYNSFLSIGASLGYRYFDVSTAKGNCQRDGGCSLLVHYVSGMAHLKFNVLEFNQHQFWLLTEGSLILPIAYSNKVPQLDKSAFESSFSLQGTLGGGLGFDFNFGKWIFPVSINGSLYMPWSNTTTILTGGFQAGLKYQF